MAIHDERSRLGLPLPKAEDEAMGIAKGKQEGKLEDARKMLSKRNVLLIICKM